jgi:hypothetical protein
MINGLWRLLLLSALLASPSLSAASENASVKNQCSATSAKHAVALLELYTSEGCSSCPPADAWLSRLPPHGLSAEQVVLLALHVDYWNYIGWEDPFSQHQFTQRQRRMGTMNHLATIYTPQFLLNGRDLRHWYQTSYVSDKIAHINAMPPAAQIKLKLVYADSNRLRIGADVRIVNAAASSRAELFLAVYENRLSRQVTAGENAGRTLHHNFVARKLLGPFPAAQSQVTHEVALASDWKREDLGVAAFVQDRRNGEVLQALAMPLCKLADSS